MLDKRIYVLFLVVLLVLFILATNSYAQSATTGSVIGVIKDGQGAAIENATIKIQALSTNRERISQSLEDGSYNLPQLLPGTYKIVIEANGFEAISKILMINVGSTALVEFTLIPIGSTNIIEVNADSQAAITKTENSTIVNERAINNLPINQRNFLDFSFTSARANPDRLRTFGVVATSGLSFNGQSGRNNNVTIDGVDNNERISKSVRTVFSQEAIQEFQVVSDSYSAEFGRALSGVINIVTKTGNNTLQGSVFLFNRNASTSARDVFVTTKPPFSQYQFGTTLSGPVKANHSFFFASFERFSVNQNNIVTIDDATVRAAKSQGFTITSGANPFSTGRTALLGRFDTQLSNNDSLWIRYNGTFGTNGALERFGGLIAQNAGGREELRDNTVAISNTYFNTSLVNETRFLIGKRDQNITALDEVGPQIQLSSAEGLINFGRGITLPSINQQDSYQVISNTTLVKNSNQIKLGIDYLQTNTSANVLLVRGGQAFFAPIDLGLLTGFPNVEPISALQTLDPSLRTPAQKSLLTIVAAALPSLLPGFPSGVPLADLALPTFFAQGFADRNINSQIRSFSAFVQNDFRVRPNLLIKAGIRYDLNRIENAPRNKGNIGPRIGFTYQPTKLNKVLFRGHYGLFFDGGSIGTIGVSRTFQLNQVLPFVFPFSVLAFAQPGNKFPEGQLPNNIPIFPQTTTNLQPDPSLRNSYSQQASLSVRYSLPKEIFFTIDYIYVRGIKLVGLRDINSIVNPIPNNPLASVLTGRVDPTRGQILSFESAYDSYYQGVTVTLEKRFASRISVNSHYTFSKAIDNFFDSLTGIPEQNNSLRVGLERGLSIQDGRHRFVFSSVFDIGTKKNVLLKDFRLSNIISINSGTPYNLLAGVDLNQSGDLPNSGDRPREGGVAIGRNRGILPSFAIVDMRLSRSIKFNQRINFDLLVEGFNLFNRVNISDINRIFLPNSQGQFNLPRQENGRFVASKERFRNAFATRQFQFGLKIRF